MKKESLLLIFSGITISNIRRYVYAHVCYSCRVKRKSLLEKVNSISFVDFRRPYWCTNSGTPIWRLHTRLYKGAWNVSANNSETVGHKDKILGHIVYILVFLTFHFLGFFHWTVSNLFFVTCQWKRSQYCLSFAWKMNILGETWSSEFKLQNFTKQSNDADVFTGVDSVIHIS